MAWKRQDPTKYRKSQIVLSVLLLILLVIASFTAWWLVGNEKTDVNVTPIESSTLDTKEPQPQIAKQAFDSSVLQSTVDDWVNSIDGVASVVIADENGNVLAAHNSDQVYFAASLYKLFVAYEGYQLSENTDESPDASYLNGKTREECLDLMIRDSDSPCGERMLAELGGLELTIKLRDYGMTNTSMTNISTTAFDAMKVLSLVQKGKNLSELSRSNYLDSLLTQDALYRRGLPSGFSDQITVYNKVGWNEQKEWHDAAIIENTEGNKLIITVLSENVGSAKIGNLATSIETAIN